MTWNEDYYVPKKGVNERYDEPGTLGNYQSSETPFPNPEGVRLFTGFGADAKDLERGWCDPGVHNLPNYDKVNYNERWTEPSVPDEGPGETGILPKDVAFRMKNRQSRGLFTRPRLPTERS